MITRADQASWRGDVCPACGEAKTPRKYACDACWGELPLHYRDAIARQIGAPFAEAMCTALMYLDAEQLHLPTEVFNHAHEITGDEATALPAATGDRVAQA